MPTISTIFGIIIRMYFDDHAPPQFHAYYAEHHAAIVIETPRSVMGNCPDVHWP